MINMCTLQEHQPAPQGDTQDTVPDLMHVGVYGSLRAGLHNNYLLRDAALVHTLLVRGIQLKCNAGAGFPYATIPVARTGAAVVEVYDLQGDMDVLRNLDMLEGHPRWYVRTKCTVDNEVTPNFWLYTQPEEALDHLLNVPDGNWTAYYTGRSRVYA